MPYVDPAVRAELDGDDARDPANVGELNYVITTLLDDWLGDSVNYGKVNAAIGVLECAKLELYRRVAAPYEDGKQEANGDVYRPREAPAPGGASSCGGHCSHLPVAGAGYRPVGRV